MFAPVATWQEVASVTNVASIQLTATSGQYVDWPDATGILSGGEASIYISVNVDSLPGTNQVMRLFSKFGTTAAKQAFLFNLKDIGGTTTFWEMYLIDSSGNVVDVQWQISGGASTGTTYKLHFMWDGAQSGAANQCSLEVDSVDQGAPTVVTDQTITSIRAVTAEPFDIGAVSAYGQYYDGRIDDFLWYSDLAETSLELHYKFENDATDSSGNGRDATERGSPTYGSPLT